MQRMAMGVHIGVMVNGFRGAALLTKDKDVNLSLISQRLAREVGCPLWDCEEEDDGGGDQIRITNVKIRILLQSKYYSQPYTLRVIIKQQMGEGEEEEEVILGRDFFFEIGKKYFDHRRKRMMTDLLGPIYFTQPSSFRKDYESVSYGSDDDGRVILLFDMDCFEVQVHQKAWMIGKPRVVANYSGRILAVSYEAKLLGVNRESTPFVDQAKRKIPDLIVIPSPTGPDGKRPDSSVSREATERIKRAIKSALEDYPTCSTIFEYASSDEFYVEIGGSIGPDGEEGEYDLGAGAGWSNTFLYDGQIKGYVNPGHFGTRINQLSGKQNLSLLEEQEARLILGAQVGWMVVETILEETGYQSSLGIGSKKLIAKIASGVHKPGCVTISTPCGFDNFSQLIKIEDIPTLGGSIGQRIKNTFNIRTMWELQNVNLAHLKHICFDSYGESSIGEEKAKEFLNLAHGLCDEIVSPKDHPKGCGISEQCHDGSFTMSELIVKLKERCEEMFLKLKFEEKNNDRIPWRIKLSIKLVGREMVSSTIEFAPGGQWYWLGITQGEDLFHLFWINLKNQFNQAGKTYAIKIRSIQLNADF